MLANRPQRYRNAVAPHIYIEGAAEAIEFYKRAFGASEIPRIARKDGKILHSELKTTRLVGKIGSPDDKLYGEPPSLGRCTAGLHIFLDDNEPPLRRAVDAGAELIQTRLK